MSLLHPARACAALLAVFLGSCTDSKDAVSPNLRRAASDEPSMTLGTGSTSNLLGRATFTDPKDPTFEIKRITDKWHVDVMAKPSLDVAVQTITFNPGAQSGWHMHPGPVFIEVVEGTMTFYESDDPTCTPIVRTAGQGYLDAGDHAHIARNETGLPAKNVVVYLAPPGKSLRIDAPRPGNCPF